MEEKKEKHKVSEDKIKDKPDFDPVRLEMLDKLADFIDRKELGIIAIMTLESTRPLHFVGSQALLFFEPFLTVLFSGEKVKLFRECIEEKKYVDYLLNKIEELQNR